MNKKSVLGSPVLMAMPTEAAGGQQYDNESDFEVVLVPVKGGKPIRIIRYVGSNKTIRIPPKISIKTRRLRVTGIADLAFAGKQLTSVTIPASVKEIGGGAFGKNQLTSVTIPARVTEISEATFAYNKLTSITIPDSVIKIGSWAFAENQLTSVTIPNSVTEIGPDAFTGNPLTSVTFQGKNTAKIILGVDAFPGGLRAKYLANGPGTYTRPDENSEIWTKQ